MDTEITATQQPKRIRANNTCLHEQNPYRRDTNPTIDSLQSDITNTAPGKQPPQCRAKKDSGTQTP
jgi:hypothetical protein